LSLSASLGFVWNGPPALFDQPLISVVSLIPSPSESVAAKLDTAGNSSKATSPKNKTWKVPLCLAIVFFVLSPASQVLATVLSWYVLPRDNGFAEEGASYQFRP
jgi:hypothetical protein